MLILMIDFLMFIQFACQIFIFKEWKVSLTGAYLTCQWQVCNHSCIVYFQSVVFRVFFRPLEFWRIVCPLWRATVLFSQHQKMKDMRHLHRKAYCSLMVGINGMSSLNCVQALLPVSWEKKLIHCLKLRTTWWKKWCCRKWFIPGYAFALNVFT